MMKYRESERRDGEVFLGNHTGAIEPEFGNLKTLRLGENALDIDGKMIPREWGCRPLFIHESEHDRYDSIMMARFRAIRGYNV